MMTLVRSLSCFAANIPLFTPDQEHRVTEFRIVPHGWWAFATVFAIALICWFVFAMYRSEGRVGASLRARTFLAFIRCILLVALAVIFLEPVSVKIIRRWVDSFTLLLVDNSSSMDLTDIYPAEGDAAKVRAALGTGGEPPIRRMEVLKHLLQASDGSFLNTLAKNNRLKVFSFADEPTLLMTTDRKSKGETPMKSETAPTTEAIQLEDIPERLTATGRATNIERAIQRAVESVGGAPVASIIVLSDGGFNQGAPPEEAVTYAKERQIPIHTVGIGDPAPPRNVRVTDLVAPENAFQKDPFGISARFVTEGLDGQILRVELKERSASGADEGRIVETKQRMVGPGGAIDPVIFERRQDRTGRFVYTVQVPAVPGETVVDDNGRQTTVNVIDSRTKVLLVSGGPSWEYQFVSRLFERDETIDVSCWLQSADLTAVRDGDVVIDHLPRQPEELFAYDVVVLLDPDSAEFDNAWCRQIDTFVTEHGGGLLFAAARPRTPEFLRNTAMKPLIDLLPVVADPEADLVLNRIGHYQLSGSSLEIAPTAFAHPILKVGDEPASSRLAWQSVGDIHWHFPVLREKPAATVLMRHADARMRNAYGGHILAAVHFAGAGRVGFLAFDGTWRWRRPSEELFNRFWVQWIRHLAEGKLLGGSKRGLLLTDAEESSIGETVNVSARLFDARFEPLVRDQLTAQYSVEGESKELTLTPRRDEPGWYEGRFAPTRTGNYRITLRVPSAVPGEHGEIAREIRVSRPNIEILRPQMDRTALSTLATHSHGGRYYDIDEAAALPATIPDLHQEIPIRSRPTTLWDNAYVLSILVSLLSLEWAVRKWKRLL